jgi:hypothetical protein
MNLNAYQDRPPLLLNAGVKNAVGDDGSDDTLSRAEARTRGLPRIRHFPAILASMVSDGLENAISVWLPARDSIAAD